MFRCLRGYVFFFYYYFWNVIFFKDIIVCNCIVFIEILCITLNSACLSSNVN